MTQAEYKHPRNVGRRKMVVVTLLVLVLCLACFGLGIMVGGSGSEEVAKQTSGQTSGTANVREISDAPPALSDTDQGVAKRELEQKKPDPLQEQPLDLVETQNVSEEESPAQIEEILAQDAPLGSGINPRKKSTASSKEDMAESQQTQQPAETETQAAAPAPAPQESASASSDSAVAAVQEGRYVVQIASFRAKTDARALAQKLKPEFPAYVREVDLGEKGTWFRVLVGPVAQRDEADQVQRRIKESMELEGFVKKAP